MTGPDENREHTSKDGEFNIEIDPKLTESLQGGLNALDNVFGGLIEGIKDAVGLELMRNMEVASWVEQLATCLDEIAAGLKESGCVPDGPAGQISFYAEQFDNAFTDSKLAADSATLRCHIDDAASAVESATTDNAAEPASVITRAAG